MTFRTIVALLAFVAIAACGGAATEAEVEESELIAHGNIAADVALNVTEWRG